MDVFSHILSAGWVLWPLLGCLCLIAYTATYRYTTLAELQRVDMHAVSTGQLVENNAFSETFNHAVAIGKSQLESKRSRLDEIFFSTETDLQSFRNLILSLTALAPLLGLLGTVEGMIETFDSLGSMQMYSQSGGIAGGISKALVSTQVGLLIAVPGLIASRVLNKQEENVRLEISRLKSLLLAGERTES